MYLLSTDTKKSSNIIALRGTEARREINLVFRYEEPSIRGDKPGFLSSWVAACNLLSLLEDGATEIATEMGRDTTAERIYTSPQERMLTDLRYVTSLPAVTPASSLLRLI